MIYINEKSEVPIYQQIYEQIKKDIVKGGLVKRKLLKQYDTYGI